MSSSESAHRQIPEAAYRVADEVFERDLVTGHGDELHLALCAASPHIRLDEVNALLGSVRYMTDVGEVIRFLESRRNVISMFAE